jgi:hypothetical protein
MSRMALIRNPLEIPELMLQILRHLEAPDLRSAASVSRAWHHAATDHLLWKRLLGRRLATTIRLNKSNAFRRFRGSGRANALRADPRRAMTSYNELRARFPTRAKAEKECQQCGKDALGDDWPCDSCGMDYATCAGECTVSLMTYLSSDDGKLSYTDLRRRCALCRDAGE